MITQKEYSRRRARLMQMMGKGAIGILPAAPGLIRNRDVEYPYRQDSDFYYLSGFAEPEGVIVIIPGRPQGEYILFCQEDDPTTALWHGANAGQQGAVEQFSADDSFPITDIEEILPGLLENKDRVFYTMGLNQEFDKRLINWLNQLRNKARAGVHGPLEMINLDHLLHEMRLFKSRSEVKLMRQAAVVSSRAHKRAMQRCKPNMTESQVEAELIHEFMTQGCRHTAYPSIVGGGKNSCILHYIDNNEALQSGDLLLVDAGAECDYYAADITRTFPVNGVFSQAQKDIYQLVLDAQLAAIDAVKPGNDWNDPHNAAVQVITKGLVRLGLLKGRVPTLIKNESYKKFFMHRTGHWLGMDVHDVGDYKVADLWRELEPGMVLTVEPGIYIPAGTQGVAKKWWNIGVRIEDDVLVTKGGCDVLSKQAPKTIEEIETIMATS